MLEPIAAAVLVLLLSLRERRGALLWLFAVGGVQGTVLLLKMSLAGCAPPSPLAAVSSPSGHTASAAIVYGGLFAILEAGVLATLLPSTAIAGLIGATRVLLGRHTVPEVLIGGGVGVLGAGLLAGAWVPARPACRPLRRFVPALALGLLLLLHGVHWQAETLIRHAAYRFWPLRACD